ncbi:MAG: transglutaminaseTgpA domain-containing protein [Propionicimonas sp.]
MSAAAMTRRWAAVVDVAVLALLAGLALVPLASAFTGQRFWLAAGGGVLVGTGVAVLGTRLRAGVLGVAGLTIIGYFAFGGLLALRDSAIFGVVPGLDTLRDLALDVVFGWKQLLTVSTPVSGFDHLFGVPYLAGLVGAVLAVSLALRFHRYQLGLVPVGALLVFAIAFGDDSPLLPPLVGSAVAAIALGWVAWRRQRARTQDAVGLATSGAEEVRRAATRRLLLAGATLVLATGLATGAAGLASGGWDRATLREQVVPPQEVRDYASPLMSFRKLVEDGVDSTLFTVTGLPAGGVIRVASLDLYDGIVYQVSGAGGSGSGVFNRVGRDIADSGSGQPASLQIEIKDWQGVWLPDAGYPTGVRFSGPRADALASGLTYNRATGTALDTAGLRAGDSYTLTTRIPVVPSEDQLAKAKVARVATPVPERMPEGIQDRLDEAMNGTEAPIAQLKAIEAYLHDKGYFSHGLESDKVKSRPGHTYERISSMLDAREMVGDDEQYAVVMALMAAQVGLPARVVMGFAPAQINPSGPTAVTGADVKAWVEVPLEGYGWVAFHPTPPEDQKLNQQTPQTRAKPRIQVPQPPLPPQEPADLPPQPPDVEQGDETLAQDFSWVWRLVTIGGISLGALAVLLGPALVMVALKGRRRARRRNAERLADRVSGGWDEIADTAADVGTVLPGPSTRREHAAELAQRYPTLELATLASRADVAVFGAGDPSPDAVAAYWTDVESARHRIGKAASFRQKLLAFFVPRSMLHRNWGRK